MVLGGVGNREQVTGNSAEVIITPKPRQALVIAECGRQIGFCLACRTRAANGDGSVVHLTNGIADGTTLTDAQFRASKEEADLAWRARYPEAVIKHMECPVGMNPLDFARAEAERMVGI